MDAGLSGSIAEGRRKKKMESSFKGGLTEPERKREGLIVSVVEAIF